MTTPIRCSHTSTELEIDRITFGGTKTEEMTNSEVLQYVHDYSNTLNTHNLCLKNLTPMTLSERLKNSIKKIINVCAQKFGFNPIFSFPTLDNVVILKLKSRELRDSDIKYLIGLCPKLKTLCLDVGDEVSSSLLRQIHAQHININIRYKNTRLYVWFTAETAASGHRQPA